MNETRGLLGIFTTDRDLAIRSWDDWMAETTGLSGDTARGRVLTELFPDIAERGLTDRFRKVLDVGVVETLAPAFHRYLIPCPPQASSKTFDRMQQRVTIAPLRQEGAIVGALVTVEDVTERREREKALAEELKHPEEERRLRAAEALAESDEAGRLVDVLGDESWRVRRMAVDSLARRTPLDTVKELLKTLRTQHNDLSVLNSALQILALSDMDTLTPLTEFLRDPDVELRIYSALLLGEKHDMRAVPALMEALGDPDVNVRYHAIEALGKLRDPAALEALLAVAEARNFFLAFPALDAIARIGDPRAAERIVPLLDEPLLRSSTADALGHLGDGDVIAPLASLLNNPEAPAAIIAQALATIQERFERRFREGAHIADLARRAIHAAGAQHLIDTIQEAEPEELRPLAVVLGWLEGPAVERVMTRLLGNPALRREVVEALSQYGSRVVDLILEQLRTGDLETKKAAIIALGRIGDARAVPLLAGLLSEDDELAVIAAGALAKIGDRGAFEALLGLLGHADISVRQAAVGALNSIGHPEMGARMEAMLADPDPLVRESAVRIAGYFGYDRCRSLMLARASDEDENVRRTAVEHLPYLDDERVLLALCKTIREDTPRVRAAAAHALAEVDAPEALTALMAALDDADPWVRYFAASSLGRRGLREAVESLAHLAIEDKAGQVRIAAVKALGKIGGPDVVSLLASVADQAEEDLAVAALSALGQLDHPGARSHLLKALRSPVTAMRIGAVQGISQRCDMTVANTLQWTAVSDADEAVVGAAIDALAGAATPEAVSALIGLTLDSARRAAASEALTGLGDEQLAAIAVGFSQPHVEGRLALVEVLVRMRRPAATEILVKALDDRERRVRLAAVLGLDRLGSRRAEHRLTTLATTDPAPEVRLAARKALQAL